MTGQLSKIFIYFFKFIFRWDLRRWAPTTNIVSWAFINRWYVLFIQIRKISVVLIIDEFLILLLIIGSRIEKRASIHPKVSNSSPSSTIVCHHHKSSGRCVEITSLSEAPSPITWTFLFSFYSVELMTIISSKDGMIKYVFIFFNIDFSEAVFV